MVNKFHTIIFLTILFKIKYMYIYLRIMEIIFLLASEIISHTTYGDTFRM